MDNYKLKVKGSRCIWTLLLALFAFLFLLPLLWMLSASVKQPLEVLSYPIKWIPETLRWENYRKVWTNAQMPFGRCYFNSTFIAVLTLVGQLIFSSLAAYAFAKMKFRGKQFTFLFFLMAMMIPGQVLQIPRFMMFHKIGLYDNLWAIILPGWFNASAIFMLRQFYTGLPQELSDAARIDGAGHLRIWGQILMPLTKSAMISLGILGFTTAWNEYLSPLIFLINKQNYTISQGIRFYLMDEAREYNLTMAASASSILPFLILFVFCQKYFIEGIATSGMKE